jgi:oxygen-independent coproporphyrinogen III oxidase
MAGLYLHIPFCKQACHYCDFHFSTNQSRKNDLCKSIAKEIELQKHYLTNSNLTSIYFGGGTPSLLSSEEIGLLMAAINRNFDVNASAEITLEGNPDDLTKKKLKVLCETGINRLSIGIQSFDDSVLKFLNRAHNAASAFSCLENARSAGFNNISLDLIYAIPGQDRNAWKKNIQTAIDLTPEHVSAYSLTIEEKTTFGNRLRKGKLIPVDEETAASDFELLISMLTKAGYEHYEVSNFCKPGYYSKHNSSYWKQENYLGVGPGAHSYNGESRQHNIANNAGYQKSLAELKVPYEIEVLTKENKVNEFIFTTLRTHWGCDLRKLKDKLDYDLFHANSDYIHNLVDRQLASLDRDILKLSSKGMLLADKIASDFFVETIKR